MDAILPLSTDSTILTLSILGATSLALFAGWLIWLFTAPARDEFKIDPAEAGIIVIMIPLARRLGKTARLVQFMPLNRYRSWADRQLTLSGLHQLLNADEYVGAHLVLMVLGLLLPTALLIMPASDPRQVVFLSLAFGFAFLFLPFYYLHQIITRRRNDIFVGLPYLLDLLTLLVEAGEDFTIALERASRQIGAGALLDEISICCRQMSLGSVRKTALNELSGRVDLIQMRSFVIALNQQEELGTPLGEVLRMQADLMRFQRIQAAQELANKAPVKILIPMILFIFPSIFLILIGPMVIRTMGLH